MYYSHALSVLYANSSGMMALLCLLCKEGIWTCDQQHLRHLLLHASPLTQSALVAKVVVFCFLWRMLQASWYVKHYEWAYLGGPLSVTLYPIAPLPNKHQLYWEREERRKKSLHLLTGIIFKLLTWTSCGHVIRLYWLHDRLDAEKVVKKIQGHPQEKTYLFKFPEKDNIYQYVSCKWKCSLIPSTITIIPKSQITFWILSLWD